VSTHLILGRTLRQQRFVVQCSMHHIQNIYK
jgi:hypothetical protein